MTYSIRTLMIAILAFSVLVALGSAYYLNHKWYNHEVAEFESIAGRKIRVWAEWGWPGRDERSLKYEVLHNENVVVSASVLELDFTDETDRISLVSSETGNEIAIITEYGNRILLLGDLSNNRFISNFGCDEFGIGWVEKDWLEVENQIKKTYPDIARSSNWGFE